MQQRRYVDPVTGRAPFNYDENMRRHNFLFVSSDMVPPEFWFHRSYESVRRTPNLDRLGAEATVFSNAFATAPVCSPSRAAYLTGRHSYIMTNSERGHDGHEMHLRTTDTIFPEYLSAVGYHSRHIGKSHVGRNKFMDAFGENDSPWDRWSPPWYDDDRYLAYLRSLGFGPIAFDREIYGVAPSGTGRGNFYGGWIAAQQGRPFPVEATYPWYLVEQAIETLRSRPQNDVPFYLQLDFFAPHQPFAIPGDLVERERAIRDTLPHPVPVSTDDAEARVYRLYRDNWGLSDPQTVRDYMTANVLQYEVIDAALGRLFRYLKDEEIYDDSTIVYAADHGEMNCNLDLIDKGAFLNPHVLRVPLLVKPAGPAADAFPAGRCETPVSLVDIAPTICRLAGIEPLDRFDGVPLQQTVTDSIRPPDRPVMAEVWSHVVPNPCVATLIDAADGKRYLFSFNICDDVSELYQLQNDGSDGGELENLFGRPEYDAQTREAIRILHQRLAADERWKGYHAYSSLTFARYLEESGDMQRFL